MWGLLVQLDQRFQPAAGNPVYRNSTFFGVLGDVLLEVCPKAHVLTPTTELSLSVIPKGLVVISSQEEMEKYHSSRRASIRSAVVDARTAVVSVHVSQLETLCKLAPTHSGSLKELSDIVRALG